MQAYHCRYCPRWLFSCDVDYGRVRIQCPKCNRTQMVFLGGFQRRTDPPRAEPPLDESPSGMLAFS